MLRLLLASAALAAVSASASAQDCPQAPVFVAHASGNSAVRASATRVERGQWRDAAAFASQALGRRGSTSQRGAALANLCAAQAMLGEHDGAAEACAAAVENAPETWVALNNRGGALWLAGDREAAISDFQTAADLAPDEAGPASNLALAACAASG
jgi:Flp pilus assembly protein TadD